MLFKGSHVLSIDQFTLGDLQILLSTAEFMEPFARRKKMTRVLDGAVLGNLFFEPSTRSRISFGAAFNRLGGRVCDTTGFQFSSIAKGESLHDTGRVISGYVDIMVVRHPTEGAVRELAAASEVPVINGGDGPGEHPTQALLDLYTIQKELHRGLKDLGGLKIAMVGDLKYGRTVHSLTKLLLLLDNIEFTLISPVELQLPVNLVERARSSGNKVHITEDLYAGIADVDVVYATRVQQERFTTEEEANKFRGRYSINADVLRRCCKPKTILMHPLPRDCRAGARELDEDLNRHPNLAIFRQTDNGIPLRMALFTLVLGVENEVERTAAEVKWYSREDPNVY